MSGWLDDVLGGYLDRVTEREFDAAFLGLLKAAGFVDVHQLHGAYEFGKDFIGKRDGFQWGLQTKAGDINLGGWRPIRSQIEEILWNDIAHPAFDTTAPRRAVLVTTGRLVGGASAEAQQFASSVERRIVPAYRRLLHRKRVPPFEVWDRERLLGFLELTPQLGLNGWSETPLRALLGLLADTERRSLTMRRIERASRDWVGEDLHRAALATAVVCSRLLDSGRADLALNGACCLLRAAAVEAQSGATDASAAALDAGRRLVDVYATVVLDDVRPAAIDARLMFDLGEELLGGIAYPVRCLLAVESLGLLGLLRLDEGEEAAAAEVGGILAALVDSQPGAAHPISDRWACSLIPPAVLLRRLRSDSLVPWLERVVVWICDHHERSPGLASVYADPDDEIRHLIGSALEHVDVRPRKTSYLATVLLDLASVLELPDLFRDALNDFLAVDLAFPVVEPLDEPGQFLFDGSGLVWEANVSYDEDHDFDGSWRSASHHHRAPVSYGLQRTGRAWDLLAISTVLRDRHFLPVMRELAGFEN